jgi:hypothetical protein
VRVCRPHLCAEHQLPAHASDFKKGIQLNLPSEVTKSIAARKPYTTGETNLADRVLAYIAKRGSAMFDDLAWSFPEFRNGNHDLPFVGDDHRNVVAWSRMTKTAVRAMNLLQQRGAIRYLAVQPGDYAFRPHLPVAYLPKFYKELHWLPSKIEAVR